MAVLSSRMSAGGCSLAGRRDDVSCLAITAFIRLLFFLDFKKINVQWRPQVERKSAGCPDGLNIETSSLASLSI